MSDLLRRQVEDALQVIQVRDRYAKKMMDNEPDDKREEYDAETLRMRRDCIRAMWWLENCKGC